MPLPSEHSARLQSPDKFDPKSFRRTAGGTIFGSIKVPSSVGIIWGKLKGKAAPHQMPMPTSLRFDKTKWTVSAAKDWLKKNKLDDNVKLFEPAKESK
jgi:hypothetical protein